MYIYQRDRDKLVKVPEGEVLAIPDHAMELLRGYWKSEWEGPLTRWTLEGMSAGKVFVDAGAHVGTWTMPFAMAGHFVHAFEPSAEFAGCLRIAAELNGCAERVKVHQAALGDVCGEADLRISAACGGCSSIAGPPTSLQPHFANPAHGIERVRVMTLDSLQLDNIGLIKIDVEGHEAEVLRGAVQTLERNGWPPVIYEGWTYTWYLEQNAATEAFLVSLGYTVRKLKGRWPDMYFASDHPHCSL